MRRSLSRFLGLDTTPAGRARSKPRALQVEALESRWCPSTTVSIVNGNTLVVRGDSAANKVSIFQNDPANTLTVVADGQTQVFDSQQVTRLDVDLRAGNDDFRWGLAPGTDHLYAKEANIVLGDGTDKGVLNFSGVELYQGDIQEGAIGGQAHLRANLLITVYGGLGS